MRLNRFALLGLLLSSLAAPSAAQTAASDPFVTVSDIGEDGSPADINTTSWWLLRMTIRPTGTAVLGIPIAAINAFRARQPGQGPALAGDRWCHANALSDRSFASENRAVQAAIERSFRENPDHRFVLRGRFAGGNELLAAIGHFAKCSGGTGSFIMLVDPATTPARIVYADVLPYESGLQFMRLVEGRITVSTCFECGDVSGLFYNPRRRRFSWRALGD
jgi:hypothetical protein